MLHKGNIRGVPVFSANVHEESVDAGSLAVRIAAQFAREDRFEGVDSVARDSVEIAELCRRIKPMKHGKSRTAAVARLAEICSKYGATIVDKRYALECNLAKSVFSSGDAKVFLLI